ncbi:hypothetical protein EVAR_94662_1 [Eumeta japonica]|uniref:Uncharacterized protein n=1 Tax=Eumeta variegata TaxID=151549 RepID=A0A4C1UV06_EUMVA|nr:hypothetical protein EVAR_94662_1 [Eumeta japonica]
MYGVALKDRCRNSDMWKRCDLKVDVVARVEIGSARTFGRPLKKLAAALIPLSFQIGAASTWAVVAALVGLKTLGVAILILKLLLIAGAAKNRDDDQDRGQKCECDRFATSRLRHCSSSVFWLLWYGVANGTEVDIMIGSAVGRYKRSKNSPYVCTGRAAGEVVVVTHGHSQSQKGRQCVAGLLDRTGYLMEKDTMERHGGGWRGVRKPPDLSLTGWNNVGSLFSKFGHQHHEAPPQKEVHLHIHNSPHGVQEPYGDWSRDGAVVPVDGVTSQIQNPYNAGPATINTPYGSYLRIGPPAGVQKR